MEQSSLDLNLAKIYIKVIDYKSFSEAARSLNLPKSTVSRSIRALEQELGLPLILRTTRQFSLTHHGEQFYQDCKKILSDFEMTISRLLKIKEGTQGTIRLTAPLDLGATVLNPLIIEYTQQNPLVKFEIDYADEVVNLVRAGYDLGLRIGSPKDSALKMQKIGESSSILVAAPYFWQQHGLAVTSGQLAGLPYIHFARIKQGRGLKFTNQKDFFLLSNKPFMTVNHLESLKNVVLSGKGFASIPDFFVRHELQKGQLVQVLKTYKSEPFTISWVMPEHKEKSPIIKNFRDFVTPRLKILL